PTSGTKQTSVNLSTGSLTINPGIYSQIKVSGTGKLTLNPGLYVIAGGGLRVTDLGSVNGSGVTIYNTGSNFPSTGGTPGAITLANDAKVQLTAPATGTYAGIAVFQSRDNEMVIGLHSNAVLNLGGGILYAPSAMLKETGDAQLLNGSYVVNELVLTGTS